MESGSTTPGLVVKQLEVAPRATLYTARVVRHYRGGPPALSSTIVC